MGLRIEHLKDLKPDPANARKHGPRNVGLIVDALHEVGAARSIVIDEQNVVLAGNATVEAAAEAGITKVQVVDADGQTVIAVRRHGLTPQQKARLALYDNRTAELAEGWNVDVLAALQADGVTLDKMWTDEELAELLGDGQKVGLTDPDVVPEERATDIQRGDLFELGQHRLLCGDSTKAEDVARVMNNRRADVCLTDPPYGIELDYESFEDSKQNVAVIALKWLPLARENADVVVFSPGVTRQWLYPEPDWVLCWFYAGGPLRSPWGFNCWQPFLAYGKDPSLSRGKGCRPDAVDMNTPANSQNLNHPCPKPIQLWQWLIERLTFDYDALLFDPFCGSGTTLIACEQLKRRCSALEIEPRYVQVAIDRWEEFTGQKAVKVNS